MGSEVPTRTIRLNNNSSIATLVLVTHNGGAHGAVYLINQSMTAAIKIVSIGETSLTKSGSNWILKVNPSDFPYYSVTTISAFTTIALT